MLDITTKKKKAAKCGTQKKYLKRSKMFWHIVIAYLTFLWILQALYAGPCTPLCVSIGPQKMFLKLKLLTKNTCYIAKLNHYTLLVCGQTKNYALACLAGLAGIVCLAQRFSTWGMHTPRGTWEAQRGYAKLKKKLKRRLFG
jgi:hypothetical protein